MDFAAWTRQEPPLSACLAALDACREALRTPAPEASVLDEAVAELRAALRDFARCGSPKDDGKQLPAANLTRTNLTRADLTGARLDGVDRRTAVWKEAVTGD
ncbi:pentapeptide repeat-containing protein [Streptomyces sp. NPDC005828]|uniref:pentapeptide repeat-containing protein n=1 Tax=Streptomyces sp. NPDC005828 TaxID=3157071 RepID=UPI0033E0D1A3